MAGGHVIRRIGHARMREGGIRFSFTALEAARLFQVMKIHMMSFGNGKFTAFGERREEVVIVFFKWELSFHGCSLTKRWDGGYI